ncbi:MAG: ABC transporter permease subunit [Bacilli bacterium]|nr:ABC transporter permease subunit [Bacilli bacterium]
MNLIKSEFKKNLKGSIIWGIVLASLIILYMAFFPSMGDAGLAELFKEKINLMPKGLLDSFGLADIPNFSILMEYYCYVFQFIIIGLAIYAMILGTKALSKEEGDKTIEFLYSKPVTRSQIIISKMISSIALLFVVLLISLTASILSDFMFGDGNNTVMLILINLISMIPILVYWAIGFVISSFLKDDNKSIIIALGIFFGTYLMGIIAATIDKLKMLKYLSPINYNAATDVFKFLDGRVGSKLNMGAILLSAIIFIVGITITFVKYNKKDLLN